MAPLHNRQRTPIVVLAYHRILPAVQEASHPYDLGLISATPEDFEWQMNYIRRNYDPIAISDIPRLVADKSNLPERPVAVTFDDGYADNFHYAFPVLRRYAIPATFFVTAGHIGTGRQLWHDLAPNIAIRARSGTLPSMTGEIILGPNDDLEVRRAVAKRLLEYLKHQPHSDVLALISRLQTEHRQFLRSEDSAAVELLTWSQVREMSANGMEVGSHTMTHAMLNRLTPIELRYELLQSKLTIETNLQRSCESIAYPVGRRFSYNEAAITEVRSAGYRVGVAYDDGVNWANAIDLFTLKRKSIERDTSRKFFRAMTALPEWFG